MGFHQQRNRGKQYAGVSQEFSALPEEQQTSESAGGRASEGGVGHPQEGGGSKPSKPFFTVSAGLESWPSSQEIRRPLRRARLISPEWSTGSGRAVSHANQRMLLGPRRHRAAA